MQQHYDLLVIGAGSGGIASANRAAQYGKKAAVIESNVIGGTCVNVGCVPKKLMWFAASLGHALHDASDYGFCVQQQPFDWERLVANRSAYIQRLHDAYHRGFDKNQVTYIEGHAEFIDAHTLAVGEKRYSATHIIIATGGYPVVPDIPGAELGITSDGFFELQSQPASIVINGAGYIAVELASMLAAYGSDVTLVIRHDSVLRSFDTVLQEKLMQALADDGVNVLRNTYINAITKTETSLSISTNNGELQAEQLLWAIGRAPANQFNPTAAGLSTNSKGFIDVDQYQNTQVSNIYAVGDICGTAALTPVAIAQGRRLSDRLFNNMPDRYLDDNLIPTVIFTHPPIATIGLSETEARQQYGDTVKVFNSSFTPMSHAFTTKKVSAAIKLVVQGEDEKVIGLHVIGPGADELAQGFAIAIRMGASRQDFNDTIAIHPTFAEEISTLR